jgi:anti-anti-sigma factor
MPSTHNIETIGNVTVLRLQDPAMFNFDHIPSTTQLLDTFLSMSPTSKTLINFGQIEFSNSLSLGLVASLRKKAGRHERTVSLCNLHPRSLELIQMTRVDTAVDIYAEEEPAVAALNAGGEPTSST